MAIRIREEIRKKIKQCCPPSAIIFEYFPGKESENYVSEFLLKKFNDLGMERIGFHLQSDEVESPLPYAKDLDFYMEEKALDEILHHCSKMASDGLEAMGFLVGELYQWKESYFSVVFDVVTSTLESTPFSVRFQRDAFEDLFDKLDEIDYDYILLGWYHSHVGYSSFMSDVDIETQSKMFTQPFHTALVIDPVNLEMKAFRVVNAKCMEIPYAIFSKNGKD